MDSGGTSDPYVKLHLLPGASKVQSVYMCLQQIELNLCEGAPPDILTPPLVSMSCFV